MRRIVVALSLSFALSASAQSNQPKDLRPLPAALKAAKLGDKEEPLNRLLQELAGEAVTRHPRSGVTRTP